MSLRFWVHAGVALAALFCSFFAFGRSLDNGFWGDDFVVLDHAIAADHDPGVLTQHWVRGFDRPLAQIAFYAEYSLWGLHAGPYRVAHVLLHAVNATLLFALFHGPLGPQVAAGAAILFALGLGFYGDTLFRIANLSQLLVTSFVLGTGIVALRAQLERTPRRRLAATLLAALLFFLALLCHESGTMALVMLGGLMWPHRRNLSSVARKLALLVVIAALYWGLQFLQEASFGGLADVTAPWVTLPVRGLRLAGLMVVPVQPGTEPQGVLLLHRLLILVDQMRPALGLVLLAAAAFWFLRGPGAVRWLLASWVACLIAPVLTTTRVDLSEAYLPAVFLCGCVALGFRHLWLHATTLLRGLLAAALVMLLYADAGRVRRSEQAAEESGRSPESEHQLQQLQARVTPHR
jgi:hypothetical protein